jgi:multidrug efflux pump subunit AcrA (membrane-fusion protein)
VTASLFTGRRGVLAGPGTEVPPGREEAGADPAGSAVRPGGSRRRWPSRQTTAGQRTAGLLAAAVCIVGCSWYVQQVARADARLVTGSVTSAGVVDLNFGSAGVVASVLVRVGQHVRPRQLLATEAAPGADAIEAADASAVTADRAQLVAQAGNAVAVAGARAQLARDEARLAADRAAIALSRIIAPAGGIVTAVDVQPGQSAAPAGVRDYVGQAAPVTPPPLFSLLPESPQVSSRPGVAGSAILPVIQLQTSRAWAVLVLVPGDEAAAVRAGEAVTVSVPADGLSGVRGTVRSVLATPVSTTEGAMYEAIVTVEGHGDDPPLDGMTANVVLARRAAR